MRAFYCAIYFVTIVSKNRLIRINVMPPIRISIVDQIYAIYQKITSGLTTTSTQLPETLGTKTSANSLPVTLSSDGTFAQAIGTTADAAASTDTGTASHISLLKRLLSNITAGIKLVNGGVAVSSSNPLPVLNNVSKRQSSLEAGLKGVNYKGWVTQAATSAKYSSVQMWNPANSGYALLLTAAS